MIRTRRFARYFRLARPRSAVMSFTIVILVSFITLVTSGCASSHYHDRAVSHPQYHEGAGIPVTDSLSIGGTNNTKLHTPSLNSGGGSAAEALIESGISLAAYPDYYKQSSVRGVCYFGSNILERVPCLHVRVVLLDENLNRLGSTDTDDAGQFAFFVKKERVYFLTLDDSRFALIGSDRLGPLMMGANVILNSERRVTATTPE